MKFDMLKLLAGIMLTGIFTSCQKELSLENGIPGTNNPASPDSTYVDRVRHTEIHRGGLDSFTYIEQYKYDANKRLVSVFFDSMYVNPGNLSSHIVLSKSDFYYNGSDTLPYKEVHTYDDPQYTLAGGRGTTTSWLFYTGNKLLKDSILEMYNSANPSNPYFYDTFLVHYRYAPGKIFAETVNTISTSPLFIKYTYDTLQLDANENIISRKYYDDTYFLEETVVTYDNKPNPFRRFKPFLASSFIRGVKVVDFTNGLNNLTSIKHYDILGGGGLLSDESSSHQYNALGFPVMRSKNGLASGDKTVSLFYYKSL
jgi:hypothetical protein